MPKHKFKITKSMMIFAVLVLAVLFDVQCQAQTPRGYAGISIGDSVEQVTLRIGELRRATCQGLSECCTCGAYFTIVRKPTKWNAFGEFKDFSKNRTVVGVGSICIFPPQLRDVETYLPRFIPDGKGGQVDRCKRKSHYSPHGQTEVIGLVFFRQRLCYVSMIVGREAQSQVAEIMRENKAPDARILKCYDGNKSGSIGKGYKLDGIVWLTMSDTIGEGMYTGGECLVIYDEKIMAKITKKAGRGWGKESNHFAKRIEQQECWPLQRQEWMNRLNHGNQDGFFNATGGRIRWM